jgi:pimeloyl-ACP methyl ester carboxylesterase
VYARKPIETTPGIEKLSMPVSVLFGESDWMMNPAVLGVVDKIPGCVEGVRILPNCGHQIPLENPTALNRAIAQALSSKGPNLSYE